MRSRKTFKKFKVDNINLVFFGEERGQAVLIAVLFFVFISLSMVLAISAPALSHLKTSKSLYASLEAFVVAESGMEDAVYRFKKGIIVESGGEINVSKGIVTTVHSAGGGIEEEIEIISEGVVAGSVIRRVATYLLLGDGMAFNYGVHAGEGGLTIVNPNAKVIGNVFSNGPISGESGPKKQIEGSVISAGLTGVIRNINIHVDAHSYRLENSHIERDAYYTNIVNTTVSGDQYPDTDPIEKGELPISEETIMTWKSFAEEGGVIEGDYVLSAGEELLGPVKIVGNLSVSGQAKLKVTGTIWVTGNINIQNQGEISLDDGTYGFKSGVIITDGVVELWDEGTAIGSSHERSYLLLLSTYDEDAIILSDAVNIDVVYTSEGFVVLRDGVDLKSITGYGVRLEDNAVVTYEGGLADAFFSTGPGGGYSIFTWKEIE